MQFITGPTIIVIHRHNKKPGEARRQLGALRRDILCHACGAGLAIGLSWRIKCSKTYNTQTHFLSQWDNWVSEGNGTGSHYRIELNSLPDASEVWTDQCWYPVVAYAMSLTHLMTISRDLLCVTIWVRFFRLVIDKGRSTQRNIKL